MNSSLTIRITPNELQSIKQLMSHLRRRTMSDVMHYLIVDATEKILAKNCSIEHKFPSPRRPSARVRAAKAEAPKASPAPASRYPAGLEEGVKALCREVWKASGGFLLDGMKTDMYDTSTKWMLEHAAETMKKQELDVDGYLAYCRSLALPREEFGR